ncbi:MAG TPA: CDP-alcohol phosphatidyltransferase family protein [Thermoanaerobaculia bacterium]|nr:CDP-alcohol phosphatidyltransferase family protein [Thermoanaerobaculia bacterium]
MHVWRDRLHRWLGPLARRSPLSPNHITLLALALNVVAAALLYTRHFLAALFFIAVGGLADAFDGIVARVKAQESRYGDFLDHFCDRVSDTAVAAGWLLGSAVRAELTAIAIIGVALNGYIGTQIEATWHERNYNAIGRGEFVLALIVYPILSYILFANGWNSMQFATLTIAEWLAVLMFVFAVLGIMQRLRLAKKLA